MEEVARKDEEIRKLREQVSSIDNKRRLYSDLFDECMVEVGEVEQDIYEWDFNTGYVELNREHMERIRTWRTRLEHVYNRFERYCSYGV